MLSAGVCARAPGWLRRSRRRATLNAWAFLGGLGPFDGARAPCCESRPGDARDGEGGREAAAGPGARSPPGLGSRVPGAGPRGLSSLDCAGRAIPHEEPLPGEREDSSGVQVSPGGPRQPATRDREPPASAARCSSREGPFRAGELILAETSRREARYQKLFRLSHDGHLNSSWGTVRYCDIVGQFPGHVVRSSSGREHLLRRPTLEDYVLLMRRGPAITYPKVTRCPG